jgi:hypothetical protein
MSTVHGIQQILTWKSHGSWWKLTSAEHCVHTVKDVVFFHRTRVGVNSVRHVFAHKQFHPVGDAEWEIAWEEVLLSKRKAKDRVEYTRT